METRISLPQIQLSASGARVVEVYPITAAQARLLRSAVLRPGKPMELNVYPGDDDADAFHAGIYDGKNLVAVASVLRQAPPGETNSRSWRLRGVAVLDAYRNKGLGARLLEIAIAYVSEADGSEIWCNARVQARSLYERLGFTAEGAITDDPNSGPHQQMRKNLE